MQKVEFYSFLKDDYVNTALIINYNELTNQIDSATLHSNTYGVITLENNIIEVHIWENEDQVHALSDLSKRYTTILLNGLSNDNKVKNNIIEEIQILLNTQIVNYEQQKIINNLFEIIR